MKFSCQSVITAACAAFGIAASSAVGDFLMVTGSHFSGTRSVALFDPYSGALVDSNYIDIGTQGGQKHAMQVNDQIWVTQQTGGDVRIRRFSLTGELVGEIGDGMTNVRGMALINDSVYITHGGALGPGNAIIQYDTNGNWQDTHLIGGGPMSILEYNGQIVVGHLSGGIQVFDHDMNELSPFAESSVSLNQMSVNAAGNILVAGLSSHSVSELDAEGNVLSSFSASGSRGVWELGNGNIMWTNSQGVHVYDVLDGTHNTVMGSFNAQYIDHLSIPAPGAMALLGLAGILGTRRRRR